MCQQILVDSGTGFRFHTPSQPTHTPWCAHCPPYKLNYIVCINNDQFQQKSDFTSLLYRWQVRSDPWLLCFVNIKTIFTLILTGLHKISLHFTNLQNWMQVLPKKYVCELGVERVWKINYWSGIFGYLKKFKYGSSRVHAKLYQKTLVSLAKWSIDTRFGICV